jgi:hypothetical protein
VSTGERSWATTDGDEARMLAEAHRLLLRVRALLAMAESSEFAAEAKAFTDKAAALADAHGIEPELLRYPREPLQVAVIVIELQRLQKELEDYGEDDGLWATKTAEWSTCLDQYDMVLEAAAELLQLPIPRLPYGCRRHFRPEQRAEIEFLINQKVSTR